MATSQIQMRWVETNQGSHIGGFMVVRGIGSHLKLVLAMAGGRGAAVLQMS